MIRRSLSAWLGAAALLGSLEMPPSATAKPPDLPVKEDILLTSPDPDSETTHPETKVEVSKGNTGSLIFGVGVNSNPDLTGSMEKLPPPETIYEALPTSVPTPKMYELRPTVRRTLAGSLLFAINPTLSLVPLEKALDAPDDHPRQVAGEDVAFELPPHEDTFAVESEPPAVPVPELLPMPHEDTPKENISCPFLRQQRLDRHATQLADPQISLDVMKNLERLQASDDLIEKAEKLSREGRTIEAMECCAIAADLCPGSPCAERAAGMMLSLSLGLREPAVATEEAAEEQPAEEQLADEESPFPSGQCSPGETFFGWLASMFGLPTDAAANEPTRRQLEYEWERIWFAEMPERLIPETRPHNSGKPESKLHRKRSETERTIERKLDQPITVNFTNTPFKQIIDDLRATLAINIYVDEAALAEQGINPNQPLTIKLEQVALKSMLKLLLREAHLTYVVAEDVLQITTEEHARGRLEQRVFTVADLVKKPAARKRCRAETHDDAGLIKLITATVQPGSWSESGGRGTIDYFWQTQSLVINQTPDVQDQITDLLAALRRSRGTEGDEEVQQREKADGSTVEPGLALEVRGLMKACRLLMSEGLHERAAELARQAYALDPERVLADPLIYKMHLLANTPAGSMHPAGSSEDSEEPLSCPYCPRIGKPIQGIVPAKKSR